jgi:hypothetical protein
MPDNMPKDSYQPPPPAEMQENQNSDRALQLLVAQRLIYSRAKRYLAARLIGMFVIAIAAPVIGSVWSGAAVVCGAVAGLWIFVGRTFVVSRQRRDIDRGAAVQEKFDALVFEMPNRQKREHMPSLEDIEKLTGAGSQVRRLARVEKVRDWYAFTPDSDPLVAVATSQRANVSYSDSLLRTTARIWRIAVATWAAIAIVLCFAVQISAEDFLLVAVLPLLPAFLDLVEFTRHYDSASHIRSTTATEIERAIESSNLSPSQALVWQERIYELRRTTPLVPDVIYWMQRKSNERAMNSVAQKLSGPNSRA